MFKKIKRYLANKLYPYADLPPVKYDVTTLDVETLSFVTFANKWDFIHTPTMVYQREIARGLENHLINYIKFETSEDNVYFKDGVQIRGTIRVVKERENAIHNFTRKKA